MKDGIEFVWEPTPLWDGRRWELMRVDGGRSLPVGRIVKLIDGEVESAVMYPAWKHLGDFSTLRDAAERLVREAKKIRVEKQRRKR